MEVAGGVDKFGHAAALDRMFYKQCNCIERIFVHLDINRATATRHDQLASSFLGAYQQAVRS